MIIEGYPITQGFYTGLSLTFSLRIALSPAVDSPGDIQVVSSWTSPRPANSTGAVMSNSSRIRYYNNLTINLQDTVLDSGMYAVIFRIFSPSSFITGVNITQSRNVEVEDIMIFMFEITHSYTIRRLICPRFNHIKIILHFFY